MSNIIAGGNYERLLRDREEKSKEIIVDFYKAMVKANGEKIAFNLSEQHVSYQFNILAKWYEVMYHDLGWSHMRIRDHLADALRTELMGLVYMPPREDKMTWIGDKS